MQLCITITHAIGDICYLIAAVITATDSWRSHNNKK